MRMWCIVLLKRHSSIVRLPGRYVQARSAIPFFLIEGGSLLLPKGAKAEGRRIRRGKLRKAKAEALKRGLVARSCARSGRKDVVGEFRTIATMCRQFHKLR